MRPYLLAPRFAANRLWLAAREVPSWHIAPARTGNVRDLVTGADLVTFTNSSPAWGFNSSGILVRPAANVPFIEYDPATGACLGWRVWDAVANLFARSSEFETATWNSSAGARTVTANTITGPDGTASADTVTADGTTAPHFVSQAVTVTAQAYTASVFAKKGTEDVIVLRAFSALGGASINFNLNTGTVGTTATGGATGQIVACPNGWYRCIMFFTPTAATGGIGVYIRDVSPNNSSGTIHLYGAQLNLGPLAPYVPTGALTASSTADVASISGAAFAGIWNQAAGTIYAEATTSATGSPAIVPRATASSGDRIQLVFGSTGQSAVLVSSVIQAIFSTSTASKRALAFAANDFALAYGSTIETDTSGTVPTIDYATIGRFDFGGLQYLNGYIRELAIWKSRRPNTNLQSMTQ